jgi:hypothetical protein
MSKTAPIAEADQSASRFFDFKAAVARITQDFPETQKNTVFLRTDTPRETYGHWKAKLRAALHGHGLIGQKKIQQALADDTSYAFQPQWPSPLQTLVFKPDDLMTQTLAVSVPEHQAQSFVFHHELGHLTVENATGGWQNGKPFPENAADSFATIVHLQENKNDVLLPLVNSWARAYRFVVTSNATHLTSTSTEALVALRDTPEIAGLQGKSLSRFAANHAHQHSPDQEKIDDTLYIFGPYRGIDKLYPFTEGTAHKLTQLAETALATENKFAFQIGLSLFRPFLHPAGAEVNGQHIQLAEEQRADFVKRFEEKSAQFGVQSLISDWCENVNTLCARAGQKQTAPAHTKQPLVLKLS